MSEFSSKLNGNEDTSMVTIHVYMETTYGIHVKSTRGTLFYVKGNM